nr:MAG TPA: hypothetical protein [Caudoviricetes sp.]
MREFLFIAGFRSKNNGIVSEGTVPFYASG